MPATSDRKPTHADLMDRRVSLLSAACYVVVTLILLRLAYLQVVMGDFYADQAIRNLIRSYPLKAQRGIIYGRDFKTQRPVVLASNRAAFDLYLVPKECEDREEEVCRRLEQLIGIDGDALLDDISLHRERREYFTQIPVKQDISRVDLVRVEEMSYALPGVFTVARPQRRYLYGAVGGQIMGYIGEISREELKQTNDYTMGDTLGRSGVEQQYQNILRGQDGRIVMSVYNQGIPQIRYDPFGNPVVVTDKGGAKVATDQKGRRVTIEYRDDPVPGKPIELTLDMELQRKAEECLAAMDGQRGAIVVMIAGNETYGYDQAGQILAMASSPGYDPNVFVDPSGNVLVDDTGNVVPPSPEARRNPEVKSLRRRLLEDADGLRRMRHRAYQERAFPGSIYKIAVAIAGLEEGVVNRDATYFCPGHFTLGNARWACHKAGGHGRINVVDALAVSCDVYFYNLGRDLGVERIADWSHRLGLGVATGIDLPQEDTGLIPTPEWKEEYYGRLFPDMSPYDRRWQRGDTINLAIGQGDCKITPLQAAVLMAAVVTDGRIVTPYINLARGPRVSEPVMSPETLAILREGLTQVVAKDTYPRGTGIRAAIPDMHIMGKTGTAQVASMRLYGHLPEEEIPYHLRSHAWFVSGVMDRNPPIVIAILYEHGLHGSSGASPYSKELMEFFYNERCPEQPVRIAGREVDLSRADAAADADAAAQSERDG